MNQREPRRSPAPGQQQVLSCPLRPPPNTNKPPMAKPELKSMRKCLTDQQWPIKETQEDADSHRFQRREKNLRNCLPKHICPRRLFIWPTAPAGQVWLVSNPFFSH
ncbi:uncharacterized protein VTP21DRAFT_2887 [Calcarisporiella thermophila]|uniref:uncharacterized protein n=1 Tax=Calcarisporiella thermophila TaxID=911321 RepID=UPI0037437FE5